MPSTRIKEKISKIVASQLPEFVRTDYPTFVKFIEYYYEYLEQDQYAHELIQNARSYADIDSTATSFIQYFLKTYGSTLPTSIVGDKKLLIKRLNDLYESKGSNLSFKIIFKVLFDTDVEVKYPYENVLRASDGRWEQRVSIRVRLETGSADSLVNRPLKMLKNSIVYSTQIQRVKTLDTNLYEIFIPTSGIPPYALNDDVYVEDATGAQIFTGYIEPTTTGYTIFTGGQGFKVGQIFTVNIAGAVGTVIQVSQVGTSGEIQKIKFLNYGYNFTESVLVNFDATKTLGTRARSFVSGTAGYLETLRFYLGTTVSDPERYFDSDYISDSTSYTGTLIRSETFNNPATPNNTTGNEGSNIASIQFTLGAIARYPGSFLTNNGFLSDPEIRLQDALLYQPFAYQTQTELDFNEFYDIVKQLIHPSGQQLYNNRVITSAVNVVANVSVVNTSNINFEAFDLVRINDAPALTLSRTISGEDFVSTLSSVTVAKAFAPFFDNTGSNVSVTYSLSKFIEDTVSILDNNILEIPTTRFDSTDVLDSLALQLSLSINNADSVVSLTDTIIATTLDYAEPGYFEGTYAGTPITLA